MKLSKKHIILIVTVILFVISIVYRLLNPFEQKRVNELTFTGKSSGKSKIESKKGISEKQPENKKIETKDIIVRFLNKPMILAKMHKNLFAIYKPPVKIDKNRQVKTIENKIVQNKQTINTLKKDSVMEIKKYLTSYRVYGTYKSEDTKAVFLSRDKLILCAKIGDRLDGKYLIDDIQDNYIKIKALALNETIHLDMREFNND